MDVNFVSEADNKPPVMGHLYGGPFQGRFLVCNRETFPVSYGMRKRVGHYLAAPVPDVLRGDIKSNTTVTLVSVLG